MLMRCCLPDKGVAKIIRCAKPIDDHPSGKILAATNRGRKVEKLESRANHEALRGTSAIRARRISVSCLSLSLPVPNLLGRIAVAASEEMAVRVHRQLMEEWPSRSRIRFGCTPSLISNDACVCRRS